MIIRYNINFSFLAIMLLASFLISEIPISNGIVELADRAKILLIILVLIFDSRIVVEKGGEE